MSKIIHISDKIQYREEIDSTIIFLDSMIDELSHRMFVLATLDKWKEWSDKQEEGTRVEYEEEALNETGDYNIDKLYKLFEEIKATREKITKANIQ